MRYRVLFFSLLLLSFSIACSNKSPDQSSNNTAAPNSAASNDQPASTTPGNSSSPNRSESERRERPSAVALVIPADTPITVRTASALSSGSNQTGDSFDATVADPIVVDGKTVVPEGATARGTVAEAQAKGKIKGAARLRLELTQLTINGKDYPIQTSMSGFSQKGKGKRTAIATGGGAALGAIIGGIAGGGKGAAIGLLAGGGAGFAGGTLTGNKQIVLPAESALTFKLKEPVTLK